jgi:hypothetical protein
MDTFNPGRRTLLKALAFGVPAAALASAVPATVLTLALGGKRNVLESAHASTFSRHLGETFSVLAGAFDPVNLELREVTDLGSASQGLPIGERFSIVFRGPPDTPLEQDTYRFEHREMGEFPLFIVPMYSHTDAYYEAVFNRV